MSHYVNMENDDTPRIIHRPRSNNKAEVANAMRTGKNIQIQEKNNAAKNTQNKIQIDTHKLDEVHDAEHIERVPRALSLQIQQARCAMKLTQKELAMKAQIPESEIKSFENGTAIPNRLILTKINKALGTTFKL
jgi:ribosome-binding protein aMBF1 (putative translation factor)